MCFDFSIPDYPPFSMLGPEEVHFFYYDIGLAHLGCISNNSIWEKVMEEFRDRVDISICKRKEMPEKVERNVIRFTLAYKSDKTSSFFRHLRNAFAHHHIHQNKDMLYLIDEDPREDDERITMIGHIEYELLKEVCLRFFEIEEDIRNGKHDNMI